MKTSHNPMLQPFLQPFLFLALSGAAACGGDDGSGETTGDGDTAADTDGSSGGSTSGGGSSDSNGSAGSTSGGGSSDSDGSAGSTSGGTGGGSTSGGSTSDGSTGGGSTGGGSTGGGVDTDPPTVVSSTPADGDDGVDPDAAIVITFSEPMDKVSTQAAWQSASLPAAQVTFGWNGAGDTLTVTPNAPLTVATGDDPDTIPAAEYGFTISTTAQDLAGNELDGPHAAAFTTVREITQSLVRHDALTGWLREDGQVGGPAMWVGDSGAASNATYLSVASFETTDLPAELLSLEAATLSLRQTSVVGDGPYGSLGDLRVHDVEVDTWDLSAYAALPGNMAGTFCDANAPQICSIDVTGLVQDDLDQSADLTQFRLSFEITTDFDDVTDTSNFDGNPDYQLLEVVYLVP